MDDVHTIEVAIKESRGAQPRSVVYRKKVRGCAGVPEQK